MVKEILVKGQPKVKWGQIFNNVRLACMKYQIVRLAVYMPNYLLLLNLDIQFKILAIFKIWSMITVEEVFNCRIAIIDFKKSIIRINV